MGKIVEQWAGHFTDGGSSDKVWAGAVSEDGTFYSTWGKRGAALRQGEKPFGNQAAAFNEYRKKVSEKQREGYQAVPFNDKRYGVPSFDPAIVAPQPKPAPATNNAPIYALTHVTAFEQADLERCFKTPGWGVSEKVNGERCLVVFDGKQLTAYNRRGQAVLNVPDGAQPLAYLGVKFAIDGERLTGDQAGHYVAFDLLEWDGRDLRKQSFSQRIAMLEAAMQQAGLIPYGTPACAPLPVIGQFPDNLTLLVPQTDPQHGRTLLAWLQEQDREGVIARQLDAPYELGDARYTKKFKFLAEIDAVVVGVKPGIATGSVSLGLIRRSDGTLIDVGSVRSGLRDADIERLGQMLREGKYPVLKVTYLPIRTVGIKLVEPRTSIKELRTDKLANECFADQLGPDKAALIAAEPGTPFLDPSGAIIRVRAERDVFWT